MPRWDEAARQKQSQRIREWQPWLRSTGPKTVQGKRTSSRNKSPSDFVVLPGVGVYRADTKEGMRAITQYERSLGE